MDVLALAGGTPVRSTPFPTWPRVTSAGVDAITSAAAAGVWGDVGGDRKLEFEQRFATYHEAAHGLAVNNGTVSLEIALRALGVGSGDEVIVPAYTFLATATAVLAVNALPIFADIDPNTICLDPESAEAAITPHTKAIIPVHFGGHPADMNALMTIAAKHQIAVIEDAAHAHGAIWHGRKVGALGDIGSWSFQASKNMSSGEGGALTTNAEPLADAMWSLHNCGRQRAGRWYEHAVLGSNHRMTEFQAALLLTQLDTLDADCERRERSAAMLDKSFTDIIGLQPLRRDPRVDRHAYHAYQVRYDADALGGLSIDKYVSAMQAEGIPIGRGYPMPLYQQPVFAQAAFDHKATGYNTDDPRTAYASISCPTTEETCRTMLRIPQSTLLADDTDIDDIVTAAAKVSASADPLRYCW